MYPYENKPYFKEILKKLFKKDKKTYERIIKKIQEIINSDNIDHYKNLKYDLKEFKRVQIGEKVLIFKYDKRNKLISFENFEHHDSIYKKKF